MDRFSLFRNVGEIIFNKLDLFLSGPFFSPTIIEHLFFANSMLVLGMLGCTQTIPAHRSLKSWGSYDVRNIVRYPVRPKGQVKRWHEDLEGLGVNSQM